MDNNGPQIHRWQQEVVTIREHSNDNLPVASFFDSCSNLFRHLLHALSSQNVEENLLKKLERSYSQLLLWDDGYGVKSGELEAKLKRSQRIGDLTLRTLKHICWTLTKKLLPIVDAGDEKHTDRSLEASNLSILAENLSVLVQGDDSSDESSIDEVVQSDTTTAAKISEIGSTAKFLSSIARDLETDIESLLDLGSRFEEQVINPVINEEAADPRVLDGWDPAEHFVERIQRRYPLCDGILSRRLGRANWERVLKFQESRTIHNPQKLADAVAKDPLVATAQEDIPSESDFRDSGIGASIQARSMRARSKYAKSLITQLGSDETLGIPTIADLAVQDTPFNCVACGKRLDFTEEPLWRDHLLSDLQPYICLQDECDSLIFLSKSNWIDHLVHAHNSLDQWTSFMCRFCGSQIEEGEDEILNHLSKHLEEVSLMSLPIHRKAEPGVRSTDTPVGISSSQRKTSYCCEICGFQPKGDPKWFLDAMAKHKKLKHASEPPKIHKCLFPGCNSQFNNSQEKLFQHQLENGHFVGTSGISSQLGKSHPQHSRARRRIKWSGTGDLSMDFVESEDIPTEKRSSIAPGGLISRAFDNLFDDNARNFPDFQDFTSGGPASDAANAFRDMGRCVEDASNGPFQQADEVWYPLFPSEEQGPPGVNSSASDTASLEPGTLGSLRRPEKPRPPIIVDDPSDVIAMKRARNTLAARKSRERKVQRAVDLEERINKLKQERDHWKNIALELSKKGDAE
ncbi:Cross-pathway control protein 1 [Paramyrothecium foliicola]|nr:Cross-pathway control protein 1 [Paramyrothecium foliicola]